MEKLKSWSIGQWNDISELSQCKNEVSQFIIFPYLGELNKE